MTGVVELKWWCRELHHEGIQTCGGMDNTLISIVALVVMVMVIIAVVVEMLLLWNMIHP